MFRDSGFYVMGKWRVGVLSILCFDVSPSVHAIRIRVPNLVSDVSESNLVNSVVWEMDCTVWSSCVLNLRLPFWVFTFMLWLGLKNLRILISLSV